MASREVIATSKIKHIHGDAVTEENEPMDPRNTHFIVTGKRILPS